MPSKSGRFTPREQVFIRRYVATGDGIYAAEKAGYVQAGTSASKNLAKPAMAAEIRRQQTARLVGTLLPLSFDHYERVLRDPKEGTRDKTLVANNVAKLVAQLTDGAEEKQAHDMTGDELEAAIGKLRQALEDKAGGARDVTPRPTVPETSVFA